jgi:hypothetical protein
MRAVVLGAAMIGVLAGCGAQSHVAQLKPLTPSEAKHLIKSFTPGCHERGRVLIRYVSPEAHGKRSESGTRPTRKRYAPDD